jgi:hypothetical protein
MLILMTVNAEILPVGAVRGIVPVIAVLMVDCQQVPVLRAELPPAFGADKTVHFQGAVPVIT